MTDEKKAPSASDIAGVARFAPQGPLGPTKGAASPPDLAAIARIKPPIGPGKIGGTISARGNFDPNAAVLALRHRWSDEFPWLGGLDPNGDGGQAPDTAPSIAISPALLIGYRDYLRAIWVGNDTRVTYGHGDASPPTEQVDAAGALMELEQRFHQSFQTSDTDARTANEILIPIVTAILTAPTTAHGLGVPAASIQPRGPRSARAYLDELIGLSQLSASELGLRYRIDLERSDQASSSAVMENISTLQRFYRDAMQGPPEPNAMYFQTAHGRAPFYLELDEWLRAQAPFFPENGYAPHAVLGHAGPAPTAAAAPAGTARAELAYVLGVLRAIRDGVAQGLEALNRREFDEALAKYAAAAARGADCERRLLVEVRDGNEYTEPLLASTLGAKVSDVLRARQALPAGTPTDFATFMADLTVESLEPAPNDDDAVVAAKARRAWVAAAFFAEIVHPMLVGDVALSTGDFQGAALSYLSVLDAGVDLGLADLDDTAGFVFPEHAGRDVPYTWLVRSFSGTADPSRRTLLGSLGLTHPVEQAFLRIRLGHALLGWADALFRTGASASIAHARELYKATLWLHGETPPVMPTWGRMTPAPSSDPQNPAIASQKSLARMQLVKIDGGLNYYGYSADMVPALRYAQLKASADGLAALAKSAQRDWIAFAEKADEATMAAMRAANLAQTTALQVSAAADRLAVAARGVTVAEHQRDGVLQAIQDKEQEIADHMSLWGQFSDFVTGFGEAIKSASEVAGSEKGDIGSQAAVGVGLSGGSTEAGGAAAATAGAAAIGVYAVIVYAGVKSISGIADAANRRQAELSRLRSETLPAAEAQIGVAQRERHIADLQHAIAQADADLARDLLQYRAHRQVGEAFYREMVWIMDRLFQRNLDMAARAAWLAERALAYELARTVSVIRFDYVSAAQGTPEDAADRLAGADFLQSDLAALESTRVQAIRGLLPIEHTVSMLTDFPLALGQLKSVGRCTFGTTSDVLRSAYPGTYDHRIRAVSVQIVRVAGAPPVRGMLVNDGASVLVGVRPEDRRILLRPADAMPISELDLARDLRVFGLGDASLLPLEGSGFETTWTLVLPLDVNAASLDGVVDVRLTFHVLAAYSPQAASSITLADGFVSRIRVTSARLGAPSALGALQRSDGAVPLPFDLAALGLPRRERRRQIGQLALLLVGRAVPETIVATFAPERSTTAADVTFTRGIATSAPGTPLALLLGLDPAQTFTLTIDKSKNPGVDWSRIEDVLLAVDYGAHWA